ncbi:hypothetical protein SMICM304S_01496 [Streptomyces microflavus]
MPKFSGRVYFSYGQKLVFKVTTGGLVQPAVQNPSDPNRNILFDWTEYTLNDAGLWINSTQVDMFSAPYSVGVKTPGGSVKNTGRLQGGRLQRRPQLPQEPARRLVRPPPDPVRRNRPARLSRPAAASVPAPSRPAS